MSVTELQKNGRAQHPHTQLIHSSIQDHDLQSMLASISTVPRKPSTSCNSRAANGIAGRCDDCVQQHGGESSIYTFLAIKQLRMVHSICVLPDT